MVHDLDTADAGSKEGIWTLLELYIKAVEAIFDVVVVVDVVHIK